MIILSGDIESDGPCPGINNMLGFGFVAIDDQTKKVIDTFEANITPQKEFKSNPETMKWWATQTDAWNYLQTNQLDPYTAMDKFNEWVSQFKDFDVVYYPASYDHSFMLYYCHRYIGSREPGSSRHQSCGSNPLGFSTRCIGSYLAAMRDIEQSSLNRWKYGDKFKDDLEHTHKGLDDALEQGMQYINAKNYAIKLKDKLLKK
jgi:hypothetical protein